MAPAAETELAQPRVPLLTVGSRRAALATDDGVRIEAEYRPAAGSGSARAGAAAGRPGAPPSELAIVLAHGFAGALERPALRRAAEVFTGYGAVVTFSFRGHGGSGGRSTVGDREVLDVDAAVRWARALGHTRIATVGFSMGGSVVLRHAGLWHGGRTETRIHAVVSVSAPARWYYRGTAPMRRLHWAVTKPSGRLVSRYGLRTRIHPEEWDRVPIPPVEAVRRIAPTPLLLVHGDRDAYFPLDHPVSLAEAAGQPSELWIERGFGHAENAAGPELLHRIGSWLERQARRAGSGAGDDGPFPRRRRHAQ